jgi:hypothetical protein
MEAGGMKSITVASGPGGVTAGASGGIGVGVLGLFLAC